MSKENSIKVSVIIPVFNGSNYLAEAIHSVRNQSYSNIELIVVNDGSSDFGRTAAVIADLKDLIDKSIIIENSGVSTAINTGVEISSGDYLAWLSHDDVWKPSFIEDVLKLTTEHKRSVVACMTANYIGAEFIGSPGNNSTVLLDEPVDYFKKWIYACALLIPRQSWVDLKGLNSENRTTQDVELILNLLSKEGIYYLNKILVGRRIHEEQLSNTKMSKNISDSYHLFERIYCKSGIDFFFNSASHNYLQWVIRHIIIAWHYQKDRRSIENKTVAYIIKNASLRKGYLSWMIRILEKHRNVFRVVVWGYYDTLRFLAKLKN